MHAAPRIYVVLAGSEVSSAAGIKTGWQVVEDLVRRIAIAEGVDPSELGDDPAAWWGKQGRPELRYDTLLGAMARTDAARQAVLRTYFEPPLAAEGSPPVTPAHTALAQLVASGRVRVIITTNFDRLIERALDTAGVSAQVITSSRQVGSMGATATRTRHTHQSAW